MAASKNGGAVSLVEQEVPEAEEEITIRPIVTRDLFTIVRVVVPKLDMNKLRDIFSEEPPEGPEKEAHLKMMGIQIILMVLEVAADEEVQKWIADLADMTLEQLMDSPINTSYKIILALTNNEELRGIFTTLLR